MERKSRRAMDSADVSQRHFSKINTREGNRVGLRGVLMCKPGRSGRVGGPAGVAPLFCGDGKTYQGKVVAQTSLNVRSGPNTANAKLYSNARGEIIDLVCKVDSQTVGGNPRWYQLPSDSSGQWVSARYMSNIGAAPPYC
jgi:hypothetical protein